jgi:hypothetical protein
VLLEYFLHINFQANVLLSDYLRDVNLIKQFILNNLRHQSMDGFYGSFTARKKKHIMSQIENCFKHASSPHVYPCTPIMVFSFIHTPKTTPIWSLPLWFLAFWVSFDLLLVTWTFMKEWQYKIWCKKIHKNQLLLLSSSFGKSSVLEGN